VRIVTTAGKPRAAMSAAESTRAGAGVVGRAAVGVAATFACGRGGVAQAAAASKGSIHARIVP
jgi:hypothetical protein